MNSLRALTSSPAAYKYDLVAKISATLVKGNALIRIRATQLCLAFARERSNPRPLEPDLEPDEVVAQDEEASMDCMDGHAERASSDCKL